jgi:hypothetical protein
MQVPTQRTKRRGRLLLTLITLHAASLLLLSFNLVTWTSNPHALDGLYLHMAPDVIIGYRIAYVVISTTILIGILRWKRIAVYGLLLFWMVDLILSLTVLAFDPAQLLLPPLPVPPASLAYLFASIFLITLWFCAIKRKWSNFA